MPVDAPGARIAGVAAVPPPPATPVGRVRGTLAGRIAMVTTAVALLMALIVVAVAVPQIRSAGQAEALAYLSRTADLVVDSVQGDTDRSRPRGGMWMRNDDFGVTVVPPGAAYPSYLDRAAIAVLTEQGRVGLVTQEDGAALLVQGRVLDDGTVLLITQPSDISSRNTAADITRLLVALALGVVIAVLAGVVLARRLARPLKVAAATAEEMAHGRRDVTITPEGPVEVAEVAQSLNNLNSALTLSEARQREFLLSVSHELRTPLTSIRGYAEAFADGVLEPSDVAPTAGLMVAESARLERIVADLLDLARMGAREVRIDAVATDVVPVLADAAHVWHDLCTAEGVPFTADLPAGPIEVVTDATRLRQIVDNLIANALRMTPPGQPIVLAARADGPTLTIEVRDGGPGLTDDDLAVAFEPAELYSRYRGVRQVGSGVGLALVGRLAQRLGGSAAAGHAPEGGAAFVITLPRSGPPQPPAAPMTG